MRKLKTARETIKSAAQSLLDCNAMISVDENHAQTHPFTWTNVDE